MKNAVKKYFFLVDSESENSHKTFFSSTVTVKKKFLFSFINEWEWKWFFFFTLISSDIYSELIALWLLSVRLKVNYFTFLINGDREITVKFHPFLTNISVPSDFSHRSDLEHSFLSEFLAMVPTFNSSGTAGQLSAAANLSK